MKAWAVNKDSPHDGITVDFGKRTLLYNKKKYWIRFETQSILWIWSLPREHTLDLPIPDLEKVS